MPRKRWRNRITSYDVPIINPTDRNANEDHHLVRHALVDFDELAVVSGEKPERLVPALVDAIRFVVAGVSGIALPQDLKLPGKRAAGHRYGVMSPAMETAQKAEVAARRQRLSDLGLRLKTAAP